MAEKSTEEDGRGFLPGPAVLGMGGSPRKKGNSDVLLNYILDAAAAQSVRTRKVHLRDLTFSGCIGCEKCRTDKICKGLTDDLTPVYDQIISSKGLVLVSPTHNYNVTSWMKAFIDRLYCFYNFEDTRPRAWSSQLSGQGRKAVIAAVCEQESAEDMGFTLEAMKLPLQALGYEVIGELPVLRVFDRGRVREDKDILIKASELGKQLAHEISAG